MCISHLQHVSLATFQVFNGHIQLLAATLDIQLLFPVSLIDIFISVEIEIVLYYSHSYLSQGPVLFKSNASTSLFYPNSSPSNHC